MKIVSVENSDGHRETGVLDERGKVLLPPMGSGTTDIRAIVQLLYRSGGDVPSSFTRSLDGESVRFKAPLARMEKIICVGKNYADHAREMGGEPPSLPVVFNKFPSAILGPDEPVILPDLSQQVDYEGELVVVIGKGGRNVSLDEAMEHVLGFTCGNDITARDWQKGRPGGQWLLGKSFDTFAPIGPWIVTRDEIDDVRRLEISVRINGETRQESNTNQLIFPIDWLIAHVSKFVTLQPGDLLFTGTPAGVGAGRQPPVFLQSGDTLEVEIGGVGCLRNWVA